MFPSIVAWKKMHCQIAMRKHDFIPPYKAITHCHTCSYFATRPSNLQIWSFFCILILLIRFILHWFQVTTSFIRSCLGTWSLIWVRENVNRQDKTDTKSLEGLKYIDLCILKKRQKSYPVHLGLICVLPFLRRPAIFQLILTTLSFHSVNTMPR